MIYLRELQEKDIVPMLEWMHDGEIQKNFRRDLASATYDDVKKFILEAHLPRTISDGDSLHFAIADETDEYLGTISLKCVDKRNGSAEYAIATRKKAAGKGVGFMATGILLKKAFFEYGLHKVFLNVFSDNEKAISLYERCGFRLEGIFRDYMRSRDEYRDLKWYGMLVDEYNEKIFGGVV